MRSHIVAMAMQPPNAGLGRREREIVDAVFRLGRATVSDVREEMPQPPSYSSVRKMLAILEDKGFVRHEADGKRYLYLPVGDAKTARRSVLRYVRDTFFGGSEEQLVATLVRDGRMSEQRRARLSRLINGQGDA